MTNPIEARSEQQRSPTVKDYLKAEEMEETGVAVLHSATLHCLTPRQIVSKWVKKLRHKKDKLPSPNNNNSPDARLHPTISAPKTLTSLDNLQTRHSESGVNGEQEEQMASFKLGAGIGLALMVAASKKELDKMMELRKQMEIIVEEAQDELRCKATAPCNSSRTCENLPSYSTTNIYESINSNGRVSYPSCVGSRSSPYVEVQGRESPYIELDDKEWCGGECNEARCVLSGMAQLESELEAELQLLELQLDSTDTSRDNNQDIVQESSSDECETLGYNEEENYADDPIENFAEAHNGSVSPRELERRLHELLEAQQLERIKELEAALGCTKQKLLKKEVEASWWKDTAQLISQHVSRTAPHNIPLMKDHTQENFR